MARCSNVWRIDALSPSWRFLARESRMRKGIYLDPRSILCLGDWSVAARRSYIRQERRAPVATAVFHSALKPCAPRILLIRYIRKLIVIRWSRVYTRKSPAHPSRPSRPSRRSRALASSSTRTNRYFRKPSLFIPPAI